MRVALVGLMLVTAVFGQAPSRPAFDVTSVRPNKVDDVGSSRSNLRQRGGHVILVKFSLRMLMGQAYDLPTLSDAFNRITGMPDWGDSEDFNVEGQTEGSPDAPQKRLMLQSLLADRFKLVVHRETRQRPVYALVMIKPGKLGPQLKPHPGTLACEAGPVSPDPARSVDEELQRLSCGRIGGGLLPDDRERVWSGGRGVTMPAIAASLGGMEAFDRPVLDHTRLTGNYDFSVVWHVGLGTFSTAPAGALGTSLLEALQQQLGLKLVAQTGPVELLVVDHVERPTLN